MIIVAVIIQSLKYLQLDDTYNELIRKQKVNIYPQAMKN